jgi:hypothetical protein
MWKKNWNADYVEIIVSTGKKVAVLDQVVVTSGRIIVVVN